ncbi:MAG TPA: hypothetical protein VGZ02_10150 [Candidatus Baltobacteraceae bacterium]|jgi:hypothetical protein|nr:hypothetical protein [Candidatus Baltobacteraceae bacterium]
MSRSTPPAPDDRRRFMVAIAVYCVIVAAGLAFIVLESVKHGGR